MNGSKTAEFWVELKRRGAEIIQLGDYNFNWFSELFVAMLLFYGPNMVTSDSTDVPATIGKKEGYKTTINPNSKEMKSKNEDIQNNHNAKAQIKHRKLEERLAAGKPYVNNSRGYTRTQGSGGGSGYGQSNGGSVHSQSNEYNTLIEDPAQFFPDHQQFFYRFIVYLDSHRLCEHLVTSIFAEIHRLSPPSLVANGDNGSGNTSSSSILNSNESRINSKAGSNALHFKSSMMNKNGITGGSKGPKESYLHTIVKLKILGKFLGLLHFWPHWTSLTDRSKMGPLLILIDEGARKRSQSRAPLDLYAIIEKSFKLSCLSLTVPWILEYLRMMTWDSSFKVSNPHREAISLLYHVYKSKQIWTHIDGNMASNRLYVMMELESFVEWIPSSMIVKLPSPLPIPGQTQLNAVDDQNFAFTRGFLRYVLPVLYDAWQRLYNKKSAAPSSKQTIDISTPNSGIKPKQLKRQTPQFIMNRINSNSLTELMSSSSPFVSSSSSSFIAANTSFSVQSNASVPQSPGGKTQASMISAQSSPSPSVTESSKVFQSFSFSSPMSQSLHGYGGNSNANSPGNNNSAQSDASSRLVDSFWQQHPQLFQVSNFIIELHHSACREGLRDKTRAIIREYWARAADIKTEIKVPALPVDDMEDSIKEFQSALIDDSNRVFNRSLKDGEVYLNELMEDRMDRILHDLCSLHPCPPRVAELGVQLIKKQIKDQHAALLNIFGDYTRRKLDEVLHLSVQQYKKQSKQSAEKPRRRKEVAAPYPSDWYDNDKLRNLFKRVCKSICITIRHTVNGCKDDDNNDDDIVVRSFRSGDDISLSADASCSQWIDALCKEVCDFTVTQDDSLLEGEELESCVKMMNILAMLSEDLVDVIIIVASKCSKERFVTSPAASNVHMMTVRFLKWVHSLVNKVSPHVRDADGKIMVEICKFFSVSLPVLIYLDFMCNEKFKASGTIAVADQYNLIFPATYGHTLSIAMRRNVLVFFENGKFIDNISVDYIDGTLEFVKRLLEEKGIDLNDNDNNNDDDDDKKEDVLVNSATDTRETKVKIKEEADWLRDPSVKREVRSVLGQELAEALVVLSNLVQNAQST